MVDATAGQYHHHHHHHHHHYGRHHRQCSIIATSVATTAADIAPATATPPPSHMRNAPGGRPGASRPPGASELRATLTAPMSRAYVPHLPHLIRLLHRCRRLSHRRRHRTRHRHAAISWNAPGRRPPPPPGITIGPPLPPSPVRRYHRRPFTTSSAATIPSPPSRHRHPVTAIPSSLRITIASSSRLRQQHPVITIIARLWSRPAGG